MSTKISSKTINIILFVLFGLFAVVQLNDPDSALWFSIYAAVAVICIYSAFKTLPKPFLIGVIVLLFAYSLFYLSLFIDYLNTDEKEEIFGKMVYEKPYLEGSREFLGLLIAALGVMYQLKKKK